MSIIVPIAMAAKNTHTHTHTQKGGGGRGGERKQLLVTRDRKLTELTNVLARDYRHTCVFGNLKEKWLVGSFSCTAVLTQKYSKTIA